MAYSGVSDKLIQESGCGAFQIILVCIVYVLPKIPSSALMLFMSFGIYDPGWRCLDEHDTPLSNESNKISEIMSATLHRDNTSSTLQGNGEFPQESCTEYKACHHIEFSADASTIATEWVLICDRDWIGSLIISIQMFAMIIGCYFAGQLGDSFGRKGVLYSSIALVGISTFCSIFSPNWIVFAAFKFFTGIFLAVMFTLYFLLPAEFLDTKWRSVLFGVPSFELGGILFGITAMLCKDWRIVHIIISIQCVVCCLTAIWVPESLRWLEINNKYEEFEKVVSKINKLNKKEIDKDDYVNRVKSATEAQPLFERDRGNRICLSLGIFHRGYMISTIIIGSLFMLIDVFYYGISYKVSNWHGNIYVNIIAMFALEVPFALLPMFVPNLMGRRNASLCFMILFTICMLATTFLEIFTTGDIQNTSTLILAILAKSFVNVYKYILIMLVTELYPTTVRAQGLGFANLMSKVGGVIAPFIILSDARMVYISYIIITVAGFICTVLMFKLPETGDVGMKEFFDEE